jgi:large subunit ribosomal protein L10
MNRDQKEAAVKEISSELSAASAVFAVDYRGISVPQAAELRNQLRDNDASFSVVKNRLAKLATNGTEASGALDEHLVGPTALTFVQGDAVVAAKTIADFIKDNKVLEYKGGLMDGTALGPDEFNAIARLPGVDVLHGQLVGLAASPLTGVVRTLNQLIAGLASQLGQVAEQGLVSGEAPAPAAVEEPPAAEEEAPAEDAEAEAPAPEPVAATETSDDDTTSETDADETPEVAGDDAEAEAGDEKEY